MVFTLAPQEVDEVAVAFASLILHDDQVPITAENISKVLDAAKIEVEPFWPKIFADLLDGKNVSEMLMNCGGSGAAAGPAAAGPVAETKEEVAAAPVRSPIASVAVISVLFGLAAAEARAPHGNELSFFRCSLVDFVWRSLFLSSGCLSLLPNCAGV